MTGIYVFAYLVVAFAFAMVIRRRYRRMDLRDTGQRQRAWVITVAAATLWPSTIILLAIMTFEPGRYRVWKFLRSW